MEIGYKLSSEEHRPNDLIRYAQRAEDAGFSFCFISDHFHPWIDKQGQSPFVWAALGGLAQATETMRFGTAVTCPTIRTHPAIIAQAAATVADMMPGRFFLGVGTGENLNEHILADQWPEFDIRAEMLEEALDVIRELWKGETTSHYGAYYAVENARIYTLPEQLPEIMVAAAGPKAAELAGRIGDSLVSTSPNKEVVQAFQSAGGKGKPLYCEATFSWASDEAKARKTAFEWWPTAGIEGELTQELKTPAHFEQAAKMVTEDQIAEAIPCGPDPAKHLKSIREYADAGFDRICLHQVGPDQEGFIEFCKREILPALDVVPPGMKAKAKA